MRPCAHDSLQALGQRNTTTFDDRPHGAKRKNTTAMMGNNDLLRRVQISPFLMAPGLSYPQEAVVPKETGRE
jgi:hypothetical protein